MIILYLPEYVGSMVEVCSSFDDPTNLDVNVISADRRLDTHRESDRAEIENNKTKN